MNNLIFGDALKELKKLESNSVDLVLTDPPYKIGYKEWDRGEFCIFTESWVEQCFRILKTNGSFWSFMGYENILDFIPILRKYGIVDLRNWVIWARQKGRGSSKHLKSQREDILFAAKSKDFTWNDIKVLREVVTPYIKDGKPRGWFIDENGKRVRWTGLGNVWVYTSPQYNSIEEKQFHPAQKPILLLERLLLLSSNENDLVLDPFMGSGSVGYVCKKLNRNFIGIENNKEYFEYASKRINE